MLTIGEVILFQQVRLQSEDYGKHLLGVDDLIQKHSLLESDINVIGSRVQTITAEAQKYVDTEFPDVEGNSSVDDFISMFCCLNGVSPSVRLSFILKRWVILGVVSYCCHDDFVDCAYFSSDAL